MHWKVRVGLSLIAVLASAQSACGQTELLIREYSIHDLTFAVYSFSPPVLGFSGDVVSDVGLPRWVGGDAVRLFEDGKFKELLVNMTGPANWAPVEGEEPSSIVLQNGLIIARCSAGMHKGISSVLAMMRDCCMDPVVCEVYQVPAGLVVGRGSVLGAEHTKNLIGKPDCRLVGRREVVVRHRANIMTSQSRHYVSGLAMEAAPGQVAPDLKMSVLRTGYVFDFMPSRSADGRMLLTCGVQEVLPLASREVQVPTEGKIQDLVVPQTEAEAAANRVKLTLPAARISGTATAVRLRSGEGLVLSTPGGSTFCVRLTFREPGPQLRWGGVRSIEIADLVTGICDIPGPSILDEENGEPVFVQPSEDLGPSMFDVASLGDYIKNAVGPAGSWDYERLLTSDERGPMFISIPGDQDPAWGQVEDLIARCARINSRQWSVECCHGFVSADETRTLHSSDLAALAQRLASVPGQWCCNVTPNNVRLPIYSYEQRAAIIGYGAVIAAQVSASEPQIGWICRGFTLDHRLCFGEDGHCIGDIRCDFVDAPDVVAQEALGKSDGRFGPLDVRRLSRTTCRTNMRFEVGKWSLIHTAPMASGDPGAQDQGSDARHCVVLMKVTPLP